MSQVKSVLILHDSSRGPKDAVPSSEHELGELISALEALGARVKLRECDQRYDEILDEVERADTSLFWS